MKQTLFTKHRTAVYLAAIGIVFTAVFSYIFNPNLNLGGDNSTYYMFATSIAEGKGYINLHDIDQAPSSAFPPGYPALMAPLRMITDSIVAQKILNGIFLYLSVALLFLFMRKNKVSAALAMTAAVVMLLNYRVLEFATIMMSEMSYLLFSALILYLLFKFDERDERTKWWKNPYFYLVVLCSGYAYQIRTQGICVVAAVIAWLLFNRKWLPTAGFIAGFALTTLPWTIRNHMVGLGANRYLDQILMVNLWRPEQGYISFGDLIARGFSTLKMLITKAVPNSVIPYANVDYNGPSAWSEWIAGLLLLAIIFYGFRQFRRYFSFLAVYTVAVFGIICLWSAPSENRYLVTLIPFMELGLVVGLYKLLESGCARLFSLKKIFNPLWLLIPALLIAAGPLKRIAADAGQGLPPAYVNYFKIANFVREKLPPQSVVCSRKQSLFYVYSQGYCSTYKYSEDDKEVIRGLIDTKTDYVVLEQLGYASTGRYLYPAIQKNPELFTVVVQLKDPDTYLLKFDREAARQKLQVR